MKQKIYYGEIDIIDTRTGKITTVTRVMYKAGQPITEIRGRALQTIARQDRQYYKVMRPDLTRAKMIGETVYP